MRSLPYICWHATHACAMQHDSCGCHMSAPEELASKHLLRRRACACWGPPLRSRGAASRLLSQPAQRMLRSQMPGGPDPDCSAISDQPSVGAHSADVAGALWRCETKLQT